MTKGEKFQYLRSHKPQPGDLLTTKDGLPVQVDVSHRKEEDGTERRVMMVATLIDDECTGWYLVSGTQGMRVLILPQSQEKLIEANGGSEKGVTVSSLWVVRHNPSHTALICEVR